MKKVSFAVFFLLFISPVFAIAQQPYARYCPDPTQIFTGIAHDNAGKPKIELVVDPTFNAKMKQERNTPDLPVTPIYDLVFTVVPTINEYCLPQYDENGTLIKKVDPPKHIQNFTPYFSLKNEILLNSIALEHYGQKTEDGKLMYEWRIKGFPNGIFVPDKLERVIKAVQENDKTLRIGVLVDRSYNDVEKVESGITFTLCAPLAGGSPHKVISMRGKSSDMNVPTLVAGTEEYRKDGFESIEPFKTYKSQFAHFADLSVHDDTGWSTFLGRFFITANSRPRSISACGGDGSQYFFHTGRPRLGSAYAPYGNHIAFLSSISGYMPMETAMHETGHSFGWLEDEYHSGYDVTLYYANCAPASPIVSQSELDRVFGGKSIQRNRIETLLRRAYWHPYGDTVSGCHTNSQARPSLKSLMNAGDFRVARFNVVSCGYLLRAITGKQELKPLWQECMKMDGVEKSGISPRDVSLFSSFFARLRDGLAAVSAPSITSDTRNINPFNFIEVETFLPNGEIQSQIFENTGTENNPSWQEVVGETDDQTPQVISQKPETESPTSPSNISDISDDSIFDTLLVDLKVDGQDGPITVEKRDRIVLSWISEGATRCRGVWSKNDIKLSGTAAGRITRPVNIKIACINADGERVDDAVRVNVGD